MLTKEHKTKRLGNALSFLEEYSNERNDFLSHIVAGDETWVAYVTTESKQQSMEWRHSSSPRKVKVKQTISAQKIMCTVFWDRMGVVLLHDNARQHTANRTQDLIASFGWEQLDHPPYSPDLAPSDYHLFMHLKKHLARQRHSDDDEAKATVKQWLSNQIQGDLHNGAQRINPEIRVGSGFRIIPEQYFSGVENINNNLAYYEIPAQLACAYLKGQLKGRALDWFEVLGYRVIEDKATDYAHLKKALSEQFPAVRNRSELETRFYSSSQRRDQQHLDFIYELLKIHKVLELEMSEEKLIDHVVSRLEPPQNTANLLQIVDKYEERFMNRHIRGSSERFRRSNPNENNRFNNRHRQENWRENRNNARYANNSRPQSEFNRFKNQGFANNRRFEGRHQGGQSDQRFHNQGGRQSGSRNSTFRGQNERSRHLNF
ncbi:histone-lysine N-methyltransferase SETMAR [Trichonephila clavipes]|nr:histone-lysine N-methyltransferase SETMAR [Trichonephila clavipes]